MASSLHPLAQACATDGASNPLTKLCVHVQESVTAVLTASTTDVLSHVAIRARSQRVLLATCFEEAQLSALKQLEGSTVSLVVDASGAVTTVAASASQVHSSASAAFTAKLLSGKHTFYHMVSAWSGNAASVVLLTFKSAAHGHGLWIGQQQCDAPPKVVRPGRVEGYKSTLVTDSPGFAEWQRKGQWQSRS